MGDIIERNQGKTALIVSLGLAVAAMGNLIFSLTITNKITASEIKINAKITEIEKRHPFLIKYTDDKFHKLEAEKYTLIKYTDDKFNNLSKLLEQKFNILTLSVQKLANEIEILKQINIVKFNQVKKLSKTKTE